MDEHFSLSHDAADDAWTGRRGAEPEAVPTLLLRVPQAARVLGVGRSTVYQLMAAGELDVVHIGRSARIPVEALRAFVDRRRGQAPNSPS